MNTRINATINTIRTLLTFVENTSLEDTNMISSLKKKGLEVLDVNYKTNEVVMSTSKIIKFDSKEDMNNYVLAFGGRVLTIEDADTGEIIYLRDKDWRWNEELYCFEEE